MEWTYLQEQEIWQQPWVTRVMQGRYNQSAKLIFLLIASFGNEGCMMFNKQIMKEIGCSDGIVRRAITELRSGGELIVTGNKGPGRRLYPARAPGIKSL